MVYTVQLYTVYIIRNVIPPTQYFILRDASVFIPGFYLVVCNKMLEQWNAAYRCILYYISNYGIGFIFPRIFWFSLHERVAFCHDRRREKERETEKRTTIQSEQATGIYATWMEFAVGLVSLPYEKHMKHVLNVLKFFFIHWNHCGSLRR